MVVPGSPLHSALAAELSAQPVYGAAVRGGGSALAACGLPPSPGGPSALSMTVGATGETHPGAAGGHAGEAPASPSPAQARLRGALERSGSFWDGQYGSTAFQHGPGGLGGRAGSFGGSPGGMPALGAAAAAAEGSHRDGAFPPSSMGREGSSTGFGFPGSMGREGSLGSGMGRAGGSERGGMSYRLGNAMSASALSGALALANASAHGGSLMGSVMGDASASMRSRAMMESVHGGAEVVLQPGQGSTIRRLVLDSANLNDGEQHVQNTQCVVLSTTTCEQSCMCRATLWGLWVEEAWEGGSAVPVTDRAICCATLLRFTKRTISRNAHLAFGQCRHHRLT